jgi:hypothetical protein
MEIHKETASAGDLIHGQTEIGMSPVQLTNTKRCEKGILIHAMRENTATVYIGLGNRVRSSSGFPLMPGAHVQMPIDDPGQVYCISDDVEQRIAWMVV